MKNKLLFTFFVFCFYNAGAQNVGIGEPSPQAKLHVKSTLTELLRIEGPTPYISFYDNTNYKGYVQALSTAMTLGSGGANKLFLETNLTPRLTILFDGKVGINNQEPLANMHISSPVAEVARIQGPAGYMSFYDNDTYTGYIQSTSNTLSIASAGTNKLALVTNFTERLTVSQNGNIGINNNNPSVNFHLTSLTGEAMRIEAPSAYLSFYDNANYTGYLQSSGSVMALAAQGANNSLGFYTNAVQRAVITPTGNIGIGTASSPNSLLEIAGAYNTSPLVKLSQFGTDAPALKISASSGANGGVELENTAIKVSGASKMAFQVTSTGGSTISLPTSGFANSPSDLIFVTHNGQAAGIAPVQIKWVSLLSQWLIYSEDNSVIPVGEVFNVLVIKQ
jgi:hypothetical protein